MMRQYIRNRPRAEGPHRSSDSWIVTVAAVIGISLYSYFQSGSSGCLRSQSGRRLFTDGSTAKLYAGGGDAVDHSSVHASQGSLPARGPAWYDRARVKRNTSKPAAWNTTPIATMRFHVAQPRSR